MIILFDQYARSMHVRLGFKVTKTGKPTLIGVQAFDGLNPKVTERRSLDASFKRKILNSVLPEAAYWLAISSAD